VNPIERSLAGLPRPEPSPALRARILNAVREEIARGRARPARASLWRYAAALAAGVLLCANLSMSAANHTRLFMPPERDGEAIRHAIMLRAAEATEWREWPWDTR